MRAPLLLLGGVVVLSLAVARALSCVCSPLECDVLTDEDCPGGLTWDPCRCCKVCARVEGEPCGGLSGFSGRCAVGLQCVIKNLLHHTREVDEGVCTKIPGRWRRHCPKGPVMSGAGCNLVGDGTSTETGNALATGKCVCGPSVPWCPGEPQPYVYMTRYECRLNLQAKIAYDGLFNSEDKSSGDVDAHISAVTAWATTEGSKGATPASECPEDSVLTEDGHCKCVICPTPTCRSGQRPIEVRPAVRETPGNCCPLYVCIPSESISWSDTEDANIPGNCIHEGVSRKLGERWKASACSSCVCEEKGVVSCQILMCKSCENPTPPEPGECCPYCPPPTNKTIVDPSKSACRSIPVGCDLECEHGYVRDKDNCTICECAKQMSVATASDPPPPDEGAFCPELTHCELDCELAKDDGGCSVCACKARPPPPASRNGTVVATDDGNRKRVCPEVKCDLHCEQGLVMDENDCTYCECRPAHDGCPPVLGCRKRCAYGYKTNKRGCPICRCRASCMDHLNQTHPEGSTWQPNTCTNCTCETGGRLSCKEIICSVACSNPLPPIEGTCCPSCPITVSKQNESSYHTTRGWGTVPIMLIAVLALLCLLLIVHIVRNRFRGRLSPSEASYSSYPPQYYKCVPAYDTPVHRNEKIVPL